MILFFVLVGFVAGAISAAVTLASGAGVLAALASYSVFGALAVVISAAVMVVGPTFLGPKAPGGMAVGAQAQRR